MAEAEAEAEAVAAEAVVVARHGAGRAEVAAVTGAVADRPAGVAEATDGQATPLDEEAARGAGWMLGYGYGYGYGYR
ncbi:hypothetical protein [Streptomyces sp. NPDC058613]|uniref:hypothetical protein n=1 Tax=Streptomyces sp. NPDC058613 TaxID=3346556 RepID=UPI00365B18B7